MEPINSSISRVYISPETKYFHTGKHLKKNRRNKEEADDKDVTERFLGNKQGEGANKKAPVHARAETSKKLQAQHMYFFSTVGENEDWLAMYSVITDRRTLAIYTECNILPNEHMEQGPKIPRMCSRY